MTDYAIEAAKEIWGAVQVVNNVEGIAAIIRRHESERVKELREALEAVMCQHAVYGQPMVPAIEAKVRLALGEKG